MPNKYIDYQIRTEGGVTPVRSGTNGFTSITAFNDLGDFITDGAIATGVGSNNMISSEFVLVNGELNRIDNGCNSVMINGNQNIVEAGCENIVILNGSQNVILAGLSNVSLTNVSNVIVTSSFTTIVGDGNTNNTTGFDVVDGGEDVVENPNREFTFTIIDGGEDIIYEQFPEEIYTILDGGSNRIF